MRARGPTPSDHQLSDFCQKLVAGAINGQQYAPAWAALALLFRASGVHLLRGHAPPAGVRLDQAAVHVLDGRNGDMGLSRTIRAASGSHGLFAVARFVPRGVDAVVVLREGEPFSECERSWMELLLAHIRTALELGEQMASPMPTVASAVQLAQLFPTPCVLTDEDGRCIERNDAFGRVLEATSGAVRGGQVVFDDPFLQDSWRQALQEGYATAVTQSLLATTPTGDEWKGHVVPFSCVSSPVNGVPRNLMFVIFERSVTSGARSRPVSTSRPLTKAELEVLASLLHGRTAKVIASTRGASVNTVRSQIATILGKTGHHSQKTLIASFGGSSFDETVTATTGRRR